MIRPVWHEGVRREPFCCLVCRLVPDPTPPPPHSKSPYRLIELVHTSLQYTSTRYEYQILYNSMYVILVPPRRKKASDRNRPLNRARRSYEYCTTDFANRSILLLIINNFAYYLSICPSVSLSIRWQGTLTIYSENRSGISGKVRSGGWGVRCCGLWGPLPETSCTASGYVTRHT